VIDVVGQTAVASYVFDIRYELEGVAYQESGRDLFVFSREQTTWRAVWRTMLPLLTPD